MSDKVHVERNRYGKPEQPWIVRCDICSGGGILAMLGGTVLGWTSDWATAQDHAHAHAVEHEKTRCSTCLHMPAEKLAERTNA